MGLKTLIQWKLCFLRSSPVHNLRRETSSKVALEHSINFEINERRWGGGVRKFVNCHWNEPELLNPCRLCKNPSSPFLPFAVYRNIYIYMCVCVCIIVILIHIHICLYMHTCMYIYIHTYIHTYLHICMYVYMCVYIHTYMYTYIHTYIHT